MASDPTPPREVVIAKLENFLDRAERLYLDVEESIPPTILRTFKHKWSEECHLYVKMLGLMLMGLERDDFAMAMQAEDLLFEANAVKTEWQEELLDIAEEYNIDVFELIGAY
jgi:hypothetical protein